MPAAESPVVAVLLRAVNVGGTGRLPMADLRAMAQDIGLTDVATYIASGNLIARAHAPIDAVKTALEARLADYAGKPVGAAIRRASEMRAIRDANPFAHAAPNRTLVHFLDAPAPEGILDLARHRTIEEMRVSARQTGDDAECGSSRREIYVHFPNGAGASKMVLSPTHFGTARNMNTVTRLAAMAAALEDGAS